MKKTGASLARFALEQVGVKFTFGIPGVHNTELYDELNSSEQIQPVLVTHEGGGAFMADAISRTGDSIGTLLIVPAAGVTHAASGIAEAGIDGIPMLVISGGIHRSHGFSYQLHEMDQHTLLKPITKATYLIESHDKVIPTIYEAYQLAISGEPGPVFVELPVDIANFQGDVSGMPEFAPNTEEQQAMPVCSQDAIYQAAQLLANARQPGIFVGWGGVDTQPALVALAEKLNAPVATTLQGLSSFPANHPLHTGMGMGEYAVPAATNAFKQVDCLLAIGTRFSEIPTGSYGIEPPEQLIHLDINADVFGANYPTQVKLHGDAREIVPALLQAVESMTVGDYDQELQVNIAQDKANYLKEWLAHDSGERVNPGMFFSALEEQLQDDAIVVADDGNHTFLTAELMPIQAARGFISPSDFNAMGYCVPATIGAKLANPNKQVVGIVGDGAFMMTGMEAITARKLQKGVVLFVFNDGELSQISQAQEIPFNRKTCTVLPDLVVEGVAHATGCESVVIGSNQEVEQGIRQALALAAENKPVIVDVAIDYSKRTRFTQGVVKTNLKRFSTREKFRAVSRAIWRRVTG